MNGVSRLSRRRLLAAGGSTLVASSAGCFGLLEGGSGSDGDDDPRSLPDTWPTPAGTAAATGRRPPNEPPSSGRIAWETGLDGRTGTVPVVAEDVVVGCHGGTIVALEVDGGAVRWEYDAAARTMYGGMAAGSEYLVHAGDDGVVTALHLDEGEEVWTVDDRPSRIQGGPTVDGGTVYLPRYDEVRAHDAASGEELWSHRTDAWYPSAVAVADGVVAFTGRFGSLEFLDAADGTLLRDRDLSATVGVRPLLVDGMAIVPTDKGTLQSVDVATGTRRWRHVFDERGRGTALASTGDAVLAAEPAGPLKAVGLDGGETYWTLEEAGLPTSPASVVDERVYVCTDDRALCELDAGTGSLHWRVQVGGSTNRPAVAGGRAFVATGEGIVCVE